MRPVFVSLSVLCLMNAAVTSAQSPPLMSPDLPSHLAFEAGLNPRSQPLGWGGPPGTVFLDSTVVHGGNGSGRLERTSTTTGEFSAVSMVLPADFAGSVLEMRGFLRSEDVVGTASLWLREDGATGPVAFANMAGREVTGTTPWTEYALTLPLESKAKMIYVGAFLSGTGRVWLDDVSVLIDGKPIWLAPRVQRVPTILEIDHEFDGGSKIALSTLSPTQIENLATLGKVWGFLKYHHPEATKGRRQWDFELFRVMPRVLQAADRAAGLAAIDAWVGDLGEPPPCNPCASLSQTDLQLAPDLAWISDVKQLGAMLSGRLVKAHANRSADGEQFYVSLAPGVGNPSFAEELGYARDVIPDAGFQVLALFRLWNMIQHWAPYRPLVGEPWDAALKRFIPRIALARTRDAYELEMMGFIAVIQDTHANLWSSMRVQPPTGACQVGVSVRFVEKVPVVTGYVDETQKATTALNIGDVVEKIDGRSVAALIAEWRPYYAASNEAARLRDMGRALLRGPCGEVKLSVKRDGRALTVLSVRSNVPSRRAPPTHDVPGETFRMLSSDIAYVKLSSIKAADVPGYLKEAAGTKGLIVDLRNYPSEFVVFALGSALVDSKTPFALFTKGDLQNPGAFHFRDGQPLEPAQPAYKGRVVILVDEVTLSQAEYTTMALRSAPGALVVGSTTSGADGNVSSISLPGGLNTMISGIGVFYPDKRPTQQVGIVPDIKAEPTIKGVREGRDEVLEAGIRAVLGISTTKQQIDALTKPIYERVK